MILKIMLQSVINNERNSRSDRVTGTITSERNNQQHKEKQNVSEHKSIEEQLNKVKLKRKRSVINSKTILIITKVIKTKSHILQLEINIIDNRNIIGKHLSRRGLHLNVSGCNQPAKKFPGKNKSFEKTKDVQVLFITTEVSTLQYLM